MEAKKFKGSQGECKYCGGITTGKAYIGAELVHVCPQESCRSKATRKKEEIVNELTKGAKNRSSFIVT